MNPLTLFALLLSTTSASTIHRRTCKTFTPTGSLFTQASTQQRVSEALDCTSAGSSLHSSFTHTPSCSPADHCTLGTPSGTLPTPPTLNITLSNTDAFYALVASKTGLDFTTPLNSTYAEGSVSYCFPKGEAIYIAARYTLNCTDGRVSDCEAADGIGSDVGVRVCAPARFDGTEARLGFSSVNVSSEEVGGLGDNPFPVKSGAVRQTGGVVALVVAVWVGLVLV